MKVRDIMTTAPETCGPKTNLASVAAHLWRADCGVLPVIDQDRELIGIISDRDICIALGTRDRFASEVVVDEVMSSSVHTCRVEDDVSVALGLMKEHRVRRLPVLDDQGKLVGILSMNDMVLSAGQGPGAVKSTAFLQALRAISTHNLPIAVRGTADAA
jgi:CBS domain-containing protein